MLDMNWYWSLGGNESLVRTLLIYEEDVQDLYIGLYRVLGGLYRVVWGFRG